MNVALLAFFALTHRRRWSQWIGTRLDPVGRIAFLPFIVFYALLPFTMHTPPVPWKLVALLGVCGLVGRRPRFIVSSYELARVVVARASPSTCSPSIAIYLLVVDPGNNLGAVSAPSITISISARPPPCARASRCSST